LELLVRETDASWSYQKPTTTTTCAYFRVKRMWYVD